MQKLHAAARLEYFGEMTDDLCRGTHIERDHGACVTTKQELGHDLRLHDTEATVVMLASLQQYEERAVPVLVSVASEWWRLSRERSVNQGEGEGAWKSCGRSLVFLPAKRRGRGWKINRQGVFCKSDGQTESAKYGLQVGSVC